MSTISYFVTVKDEFEEIKRLLPFLLENKDDEDEIVVLQDWFAAVDDMNAQKNTIANLIATIQEDDIKCINCSLNKNFAKFKNFGKSKCTKDYIFQIDADEMPSKIFIMHLKSILEENKEQDLFFVPRINIVKNITQEWIDKWRWQVTKFEEFEDLIINFPDYQSRIFKNSPNINWEGAVHEKITGHETQTFLPAEIPYCLFHIKTLEKQIKQNELYSTIKR